MRAPTPHWSAHDARATAISPEDPLASALHAVGCRVFHFHLGLVAGGDTQCPFEGRQEDTGAVPEEYAFGLQGLRVVELVRCAPVRGRGWRTLLACRRCVVNTLAGAPAL